jgi:hypothetical protein
MHHSAKCDSACYDCLRDFNNSGIHGLLDWRLAVDVSMVANCGGASAVTLDAPHWSGIAMAAAETIAGGIARSRVVQVGPLWGVQAGTEIKAVITHPLWSCGHPDVLAASKYAGISVNELPVCTTFDALRRPGWFLTSIRHRQ